MVMHWPAYYLHDLLARRRPIILDDEPASNQHIVYCMHSYDAGIDLSDRDIIKQDKPRVACYNEFQWITHL